MSIELARLRHRRAILRERLDEQIEQKARLDNSMDETAHNLQQVRDEILLLEAERMIVTPSPLKMEMI